MFFFLQFTITGYACMDCDKKKLQDILLLTFNLKSKRVLSMQKCIEKVVPMCGNENHFQATFL